VDADGEWQDSFGVLLVFFRDTAQGGINRDDTVQVRGSVEPLVNLDPDFRRFVQSEGASGVAWAFTTSVQKRGGDESGIFAGFGTLVTERMLAAVPGDAGALLSGFVTGDDSGLSDTAREAFDRTNTSHITAVSGANIAILIAMWTALAPSGRIRRHLAFQVALLAIIWGYVAMVGFGPAALRAAVFATLMIPASRFGRKPDAMTSLMLASAFLLLLIPGMANSVGFWLSMAASAALVTVAPIRNLDQMLGFRWVLFSLVSAQFATLPITF
jgi:ComEC/Rec2-related protein